MNSPTTPPPTEPIVDPVAPATTANPGTSAIHAEFRDIHSMLLRAQRREIVMTRDDVRTHTRRMAELTHLLQSTSPTGPKKAKAEGKAKTTAPKKPVALRDDIMDIDI